MVYESRKCAATLGDLYKLNARFRDHTTNVFHRFAMQVVGFSIPTDAGKADNALNSALKDSSREAADISLAAFVEGSEWTVVLELADTGSISVEI